MRSIFIITHMRRFVIVWRYSVKSRKIVVSLSNLGFYRQIARLAQKNKYSPFTLLTPTAQLHKLCTYSRASCLQFRFRSSKSFQREHEKIENHQHFFWKRRCRKQNCNSPIKRACLALINFTSEITEKSGHEWHGRLIRLFATFGRSILAK